ncbi:aromatic prenyltransferase [Aspergillus minisclerotigenes]|uniref:Aromatic prenyltransferase n=1 Tax=Aspergillus minisclerotigenes TaxID=656917 RepID=A0A5N6J7T6_9EURO|nr:aromatic prenyltransferase [Aspergillus minisclerotigenes]
MHIPCPLSPTNFEALTEELEFSNEDWKQWWYKTGPILLKLTTSSIYSIERQHQYLEFYACAIIACLGPYPQVVRSSLTQSGLPVEFSVNYQQHGKQPTVRIAFEPLSGARGTEPVAYDRDIAKKFLSTLSELELKGFDSRLDSAISVKAYVFPGLKCKISGQSSRELLANTAKDLQRQVDCSEVFSMVDCYLQETNSYNPYNFFSWDCIEPSNSRLKLYMCSASMTRAKLEHAWCLGSRLQGLYVEKGLQYLLQLHGHIQISDRELQIEVEHDDRSDTPKTTPLIWNYEMRSEDPSPLTKIYLPVHGENNLKIATGVAHFMEEIGMVDTGKAYLDTIQLTCKSFFI